MAFTEDEEHFVKSQNAPNFPTYLKSVWHVWSALKYAQARKKAAKLWKARKAWLSSLEPTSRLKNCDTCYSSLHQIWIPTRTTLTVSQWDTLYVSGIQESPDVKTIVSCWGCKEGHLNQLGHMSYGGCLYDSDTDFRASYELITLPASPHSTD
jgi:hypothetical protein